MVVNFIRSYSNKDLKRSIMYKKDFQQTRRLLRAVSPLYALSHNNYTEDDTKVDAVSNTIRKIIYTLKCLSIGTPNIINFPFVSNGKLMIFRCPNIQTDYNEAVLCLNFGTPENNEFSIWNKWKIYYF